MSDKEHGVASLKCQTNTEGPSWIWFNHKRAMVLELGRMKNLPPLILQKSMRFNFNLADFNKFAQNLWEIIRYFPISKIRNRWDIPLSPAASSSSTFFSAVWEAKDCRSKVGTVHPVRSIKVDIHFKVTLMTYRNYLQHQIWSPYPMSQIVRAGNKNT